MIDHDIAQLLDRHTPPVTDALPDWDAVVHRADAPAGASRRRWAFVLAAAAVLLLAGSALADVGPGRLLLGLVQGNEQPPPAVTRTLQRTFHWPHGTHVLPGQSRLVLRRLEIFDWNRLTNRPIRDLTLRYVAPTRGGGYCNGGSTVEPDSGKSISSWYSCVPGPLRPAVRVSQDGLLVWRDAHGRLRDPEGVLDGTVPKATASLSLVRVGGTTRVPLSDADLPGIRYFALRLTARDTLPGARPVRLVARNPAGAVIATAALALTDFRPTVGNPSGSPSPDLRPTVDVPLGIVRTPGGNLTDHKPGVVAVTVTVVPSTHRAAALRMQDVTHGDAGEMGATEIGAGFAPKIDTNSGVHLAYGFARAPIATMEIVLRDGTVAPARLRNHAYLAVLQSRWFEAGNLPARLVGRDAQGRIVASYRFTRADFPDY